MPDPLLEVRALDARYGDFQALFGIDFELDQGEAVAVIGANGAGKSTMLRMINRLTDPTEGSIEFGGRDVTKLRGEVEVVGAGALPNDGKVIEDARSYE